MSGAEANLVLVGFMGTGKSAVGRRLARRLSRRFLDTDSWITVEAGMSIAELFRDFGEAAFRAMETEAARHVAASRGLVVSTGGGILMDPRHVDLLRSHAALVCLTARPEVILARTAPWDSRPLLRDAPDRDALVRRLLEERAEGYAQADLTLDTSDRTADEVVEEICTRLPFLWGIAATRS